VIDGPLGDYGDAPDSLSAGYARVNPDLSAFFPTLFSQQSTPENPDYVLHRFPTERVYLGQTVTNERNALIVDHDFDDGWVPGSFLTCSQAQLEVFVTVPEGATAGPIYLNMLFDWDHNGVWAGAVICPTSQGRGIVAVSEWAIRNLSLHEPPYDLAPGFRGRIKLPEIVTGPLAGELWMRITLSTEPVSEDLFVPTERGGTGWDGSGDFLYGETEDYFTCLLTDAENPLLGCPLPLTNQPSGEPPPLPEPPPEEQPEENAPPVALSDEVTTSSNTPVTIDVLANDFDPDGDPLTVQDLTQPANGTAVLNSDGTVTYIPDPSFAGEDTFTYTICDPGNLCATATVTITVLAPVPENAPPVAADDAYTTDEDVPLSVAAASGTLLNDSDPDGDSLTVVAFDSISAQGGTVTMGSDGSFSYSPPVNFYGTDRFTYTISDGFGGTDTATVTITVNPVNDPPMALDDSASTDEDTPVIISVLANDSDPEGDPLSITGNTQPTNGSVTCAGTQCTYTPNANFMGTDRFTYTISDGNGGSDTATVTVSVGAVNDPPVLSSIPDQIVAEGDTLTVFFTCTDTDGDALTLSYSNLPPGATFADNGNGLGTLIYSPGFDVVQHPSSSALFRGIQIICSDGIATHIQTFDVTVLDVNRPPTAFDQGVGTPEDTPIDITLSCSDPDGDPLTFALVNSPQHGTLTGTPPSLTYTPSSGFNGSDSFTFKCNDGISDSNIATISIAVGSVNDAPVASSQSLTTDEDTPVSITLSCTDPEGDPLQFSILTGPAHGTLTGAPPSVVYTPDPNFHGTDSFTFKCNDGQLDSNVATVDIMVSPVNDPPQMGGIPDQSVAEGNTLTVNINCTDADGDALTLAADNLPLGATFTDHGGGAGTLSYTPAFDVVVHPETSTLFSNVQVTCLDGTTSTTQDFSIVVLDVNRPPIAQDDSATTDEDTPVTIDVLANDSDPDSEDTLSIAANTQPANGTVSCASSQCTYTPSANFYGTDSFVYTISDGKGGTDSATVTVTVSAVNDSPTAQDDAYVTAEDTPLTIAALGVLANDSDPDGDSLTSTLLSGPAHGSLTLNANGSFTYTPDANFHGTDSFQYQACDSSGACDGANVTITVTSVNDPPIAEANGPYTCSEGETITLSSAGSTDPDGTIVEYAWDLDNNGSYEMTGASPTFACVTVGTYTVQLRVTDDGGATATDIATVTVEEAPDLLCDADPVKDTSLQVQWGAPSVSGNTVTVTLSVTNTGSDDYAINLVVHIQVLEGKEKIDSSSPALPYDWNVGSLAPGATATFTVTLTVHDDGGTIKLQGIVINEDCRPEHTEGRQDKVDIKLSGDGDDDDNHDNKKKKKVCSGIQSLTIQYLGSDPSNEVLVTGKNLTMTVTMNADKIFTVSVSPKFPANTTFTVGNDSTTIHTSCSQPIGPGMQFGNFLIIDWVYTP
jgi:VCBS repeat-containing protein